MKRTKTIFENASAGPTRHPFAVNGIGAVVLSGTGVVHIFNRDNGELQQVIDDGVMWQVRGGDGMLFDAEIISGSDLTLFYYPSRAGFI